jgi:UDP-2,3-diacylglucosamine hydrolase
VASLFISDLHLDEARPAATESFLRFLSGPARSASNLYILGDLFEAWIGDDDDAPWLNALRTALADLVAAGVNCTFMHGNRDFLIGAEFLAATGLQLLDEYSVIELHGTRVLLTHGDLLCTDDTRYMTLRSQLRDPLWQADFLSKSLAERRAIAADLRLLSQTEMAQKPADIMDVNEATVANVMRRFGVVNLIHGHTHRPDQHRWSLDDQEAIRIVLSDWYGAGSWLEWDDHGPRAVDFTT